MRPVMGVLGAGRMAGAIGWALGSGSSMVVIALAWTRAGRMRALVDDLLYLSSIESGELRLSVDRIEFDALVLALPLNDETRQLFDAARLAKLKPGCLFVNVGRGGLVEDHTRCSRGLPQPPDRLTHREHGIG